MEHNENIGFLKYNIISMHSFIPNAISKINKGSSDVRTVRMAVKV